MSMKKKKATIPYYLKESADSRKERIKSSGNRYLTSFVPNKKVYNRKDKSWSK